MSKSTKGRRKNKSPQSVKPYNGFPLTAHPSRQQVWSIADRMQFGAAKYDPDDWRGESLVRRVRRAIKHAVTAMEMADGDRADDGEDHLQAAVCRMAMASGVRNGAVAVTDD